MSSIQIQSNQKLEKFLESLFEAAQTQNTTSLETHLTHIDQEINKVQTHIQLSLKSDWPAFQKQWLTGSSLYHQSLHLENQLDQLETKLDNPHDGLIPTLLSALKDRRKIATQRSQSLQSLQVINSLSTAYQEIVELSKLLYSNDLVTAVSKLPETKLALKPLYQSQSVSTLAKRAVYRIQELEEDLKQRLIDDVRSCFTFQDAEMQDSVFEFKPAVNARASSQQANSVIPWSSAVNALETLSGVDSVANQLKKIATLLIDKIITPLIKTSSSSQSHLILFQRQNTDQSSCVLGFKHQADGSRVDLYDSLRLLLATLQDKLLTSKSLQDKFSLLLIPSLQANLLSQVLASELPDSTRDEPRLSQLSNLLSKTHLFGQWLRDHGWLSHSKENSLLDWCDQVQDRFLHKVATRVLALARDEMVTTQWESTVVSWEIISQTEPPLPPSQKETQCRALPQSTPHPPSSSKSFSLTPQQFPESLKKSAGFKSLFHFVSGTSQEPPEQPALSSSPESKKFESLFDFGLAGPRVRTKSSDSFGNLQSPSTGKQPSPEILDRIPGSSQPSSPTITRKLSSLSLSPPNEPIAIAEVENKAEEDIDWDMGGELEDSETLNPTSTAHSVHVNQIPVADEEIEEDAWGLDGSDEEPPTTKIAEIPLQSGSATNYENISSSRTGVVSTDPSPSVPQHLAQDLAEEDEPDPDAWGFDEEEGEIPTIKDDDGEALRLRGGFGSSPATSETHDDDGWEWNEELGAENPVTQSSKSTHHQLSEKNKDVANLSIGPNNQPTVRVEQLFISTLAQKVLNIVKQVVDDAIQTESPEFPNESLKTSGAGLIKIGFDIIDLFRIIMFTHHSKSLNSAPSLSVQFSNDCDWLSYQLGLIPKLKNQYQDENKIASKKLNAIANKVRRNQIANQKAALMECLNEAEGFVETSREDRFSACQRACKQVMYTLETLAQVWKPVMLRKEYLESMGELVETVLRRILNEIEEQTDIEENESTSLNRLCKSLHPLINLFTSQNPGSDSSSSVQDDDIYRYVPIWFKFCFLSELLEASMADIMWMYQEGHLNEFSKAEIVGLIKALFADSQLRAKNIDLILQ